MLGLGYLAGLAVNLSVLSWIAVYSFSKYALLTTLNATQFAILGWWLALGFKYFKYRAFIFFPFFWTGFEYLRGLGDLAYNWLDISITQTNSLYFIQIADIGGSDLLVFWICLLNILIWYGWRSRDGFLPATRYLLALAVLIGGPLIYGIIRVNGLETHKGIRVHVFQPNADPVTKWDASQQSRIFHDLLNWTRTTQEKDPAELLIWPETALPFEIRKFPAFLSRLSALSVPLITGAMDFHYQSGHRIRHNAVFALPPGIDAIQVYHKLRPVPFEEVIPFHRLIPWLQHQSVFDRFLTAGKNVFPLGILVNPVRIYSTMSWWETEGIPDQPEQIEVGPLVCFEVAFHEPARQMVQNGADIHLVVTNDAWFGYSNQPFQHLNLAILRAIETRRSVIFCANSGFSAFIDHRGKITGRTELFERHVTSQVIPLNRSESWYLRLGNWMIYICLIGMLSWIGGMVYKMKVFNMKLLKN